MADDTAAPDASRAVAAYRTVSRSENNESADATVIATVVGPLDTGGGVGPPLDGGESLPPPQATVVAVRTLTANQVAWRIEHLRKKTSRTHGNIP